MVLTVSVQSAGAASPPAEAKPGSVTPSPAPAPTEPPPEPEPSPDLPSPPEETPPPSDEQPAPEAQAEATKASTDDGCDADEACSGPSGPPPAEPPPQAPPRAAATDHLRLEVRPESGRSPTGNTPFLTAEVSDRGDGVAGIEIDFEVVSGPGDDDVGSAGDTPASPDLSCTTAGGGPGIPATCTVGYSEADNQVGTDAIRAWIDHDGSNGSVEADPQEGREESGAGAPGCAPGTQGPGDVPDPDGTDCVEMRWTARVATFVDVDPESDTVQAGTTHTLVASVLDQTGSVLDGAGTDTEVGFYFLPGSPNDPGNPGMGGPYDLSCRTGTAGTCSVGYQPQATGTDVVCGLLPTAPPGQCGEGVTAPEADNRVDVVERITTAAPGYAPPVLLVSAPGSSRTGQNLTLTAMLSSSSGADLGGVNVDFEVASGPGDDDVGTSGNTPGSPDLSCTAAATGPGTASCSVSYTEADNEGGADAVLAWMDTDGSNATVEADLGEGSDPSPAGAPGCAPGSAGAGSSSEPDGTDCLEHGWTVRTASLVDVQPETGSRATATSHLMSVVVRDQDGNPFVGPGTDARVEFHFLPSSPNDPGSPGLGGPPDLACTTGTIGACQVSFVGSAPGTDTICGVFAGPTGGCSELSGAPEFGDGADVVVVTWQSDPEPAGQSPPPAPEGSQPPVSGEPVSAFPPSPVTGAPSGNGTVGSGLPLPAEGPFAGTHETRSTPPNPLPESAPARIIEGIREGVTRLVDAAAETAGTFGFPLALALAVLIYLIVQSRLDRKDPKLAAAPLHSYQDVVPFADGDLR